MSLKKGKSIVYVCMAGTLDVNVYARRSDGNGSSDPVFRTDALSPDCDQADDQAETCKAG